MFVVIPTYNEAGSILELLGRIRQVFAPAAVGQPTIFVIDDNSPDNTAALVRSLGDEQVIVIERPTKLGLGSAYKTGFNKALLSGADWIVQMDADLSHDPADILRFLEQAECADLIIGSRYVAGGAIVGWGLWRHVISRGAMLFARAILHLPAQDVTSGFRLWRADLLRRVLRQPVSGDGYAFQEEMLYRAAKADARIVEMPILFTDRRAGHSKLSWRDVVEFFHLMIRLRWQG
ncbi:MAG: polyprenol monophosphomannose synthase [Parcubacteria group bacterium]|nr:polyprenol monophosphomannose synthase [Parcubacteria group bacterium]